MNSDTVQDMIAFVLEALKVLGFIIIVIMLVIYMAKVKYSYYYAFMRKHFYKDLVPWEWRAKHSVYGVYRIMLIGAVTVMLRLFEQIRTGDYLATTDAGQIGTLFFIYAIIKMIHWRTKERDKEHINKQ